MTQPVNKPQSNRLKNQAVVQADPPSVSHNHGAVIGVCVLLGLAVLLVFGRALRCDFINYDDDLYFYANPRILHGLTWNGAAWAFKTMYAANWHPLAWLSLMLDGEVFGKDPAGPHLTNVLLHAANTILLFLLLRKLTGAIWRSALVAALFGLHPLHVESVAWVSERKDVLSGLFFMLTLLAYTSYASRKAGPVSRFYLLSLGLFALGLMCKPMLVTVPFIQLLLDYWPLQRFSRSTRSRLLLEKLPFFLLSAASSALTLVAQQGAVQPLAHISPGIRMVNASVAYAFYLWKMFWPVNLAIPCPHHGYWPWGVFCLSLALILAAVMIAFQLRHQYPFLITGWLWYFVMLVPVIGIIQVGIQSTADRYTYLPLVGIFILLIWGAGETMARWRLPTPAIVGFAVLALTACALRTSDQLQYWKNSETLFRHAAAVTKANYTAYYNLGEYYYQNNRPDEAISHYREAIRIKPGYDDALNNLGAALAMTGKLDEAVARIQEAIRYRPDKADAYYNLGNVFVMQRKWDEAVGAYTDALRRRPDYPEAHNNLANVLLQQGHLDAAVRHYRETLRLNPGHEGARRQLRSLGVPIPP